MFNRRPFLAGAAAIAVAMMMGTPAPEPRIEPTPAPQIQQRNKGPRRKKPEPRYRERRNWMSDKRRAFIEAHNRNPLNFLPGHAVHYLYKHCDTQREMERRGHAMLQEQIDQGWHRPKPGYCGDGR